MLPAGSADTLRAVSQGILETGGMALAISRAVERFGRVDILVNNAGVAPDGGTIVVDGGFTASSGVSPFPDEVSQLLAQTFPDIPRRGRRAGRTCAFCVGLGASPRGISTGRGKTCRESPWRWEDCLIPGIPGGRSHHQTTSAKMLLRGD